MKFLRSILFFIAIGMQLPCAVVAQDEYVDSLRKEILKAENDSIKIGIYGELFDFYIQTDNNMADIYADSVLLCASRCKSSEISAYAYVTKASVKYAIGDYAESLKYYTCAEPLAKRLQDTQLLSMIYTEFGSIYKEYGDNMVAHEYFMKAANEVKKLGDDDMYASALINIADLYYNEDKHDTALLLYDSALNIASLPDTKIAIYGNIAKVQYIIGDIEKAKATYMQMLPLVEETNDKYTYASALNNISDVYIQEGKYDEALECLEKVDSICKINYYADIRLNLYQNYHDLYLKIGDYKHSLYYLDRYNLLEDSIYSADLRKELNELENRSEREKSELELKIRDEEISHQKTLNLILFSIIAIVLVFIVIIAFLLVKKNRLNKALNKLNADLKQRDEEISSNLDYAREIQLGCMNNGLTESNLKMFVLDRPKVVVGGDFYISQTKGDASYVVVGDCTGHGISGGFLSVLGIKSVYAAIEKYDSLPEMASFINNEFCEIVSSAENLKGESLCLSMLRICGNEVRFLGSKQKMWIVSDGNVTEYKSSNAVMGAGDEVFTEEIINVKSGDVVFLSSDGYPDQFGAEGKLKYPRFRNLLLECSLMEPDKAKSFLSAKLDSWRGDLEQTDDVMVVGIYF